MLRPLRSGDRSAVQPLCAKFQRSQKEGQRGPLVMSFCCQQAGPLLRGWGAGQDILWSSLPHHLPPWPQHLTLNPSKTNVPTSGVKYKTKIWAGQTLIQNISDLTRPKPAHKNYKWCIYMSCFLWYVSLQQTSSHIQLPSVPWRSSCPYLSGLYLVLSIHMCHMLPVTCVL